MAPALPIRATFSITTPLFLGDAERQATRFALQSFKGVLRFWWRARAWERLWQTTGGDASRALCELHQREARIFGAAGEAGRQELGQSRVLLQLEATKLREPRSQPINRCFRQQPGFWGARYLGYGLMQTGGDDRGKVTRSYFPARGQFTVSLLWRGDLTPEERQSVLDAVKLLGLVGGLGARTRRGFGSLTLETLDGAEWRKPQSIEDYKNALKQLLGTPSAPRPPYSAFSSESRIDVLVRKKDALEALDEVGQAMMRYRSWGYQSGQDHVLPSREAALQLFRDDHDWAHDPLTDKSYVPKRSAFGLPHHYGPKCHNAGVTTTGARLAGDRRASPLLFHIHALGPNTFIAVSVFLPAKFTPDEMVRIHWQNKQNN